MAGTAYLRGVGAAAPSWRITAGDIAAGWGRRGGRSVAAVCAPDEDQLTLAAASATDALRAADLDPGEVDGLWWGCTRPPFAEGPSHAVLASALGLDAHATGALTSGSPHSGIEALLSAADAVVAGSARTALVVTSDALTPGLGTAFETRCGAGAAAVVLSAEAGPATITARVTRSHPLLDRYRGDSEADTRDLYDARLFREEMFLPPVVEVAEHLAALDIRAWSLPDPDGRLGAVVARKVAADTLSSADVYTAVGDTGAAAALLGALDAFGVAGTTAIVATGGGRTTGIVVTATEPVPGAAVVLHRLPPRRGTQPTRRSSGARPAAAARGDDPDGRPARERAVRPRRGRDAAAPRRPLCRLRDDQHPTLDPPHLYRLRRGEDGSGPAARHGVVHTFVVNQTMPAPFVAPLPIAVVDLDDGARVMLQVVGDGTDLAIGTEVDLVLRRYAHERGVPVYGYKARQRPGPGKVTA